MLRKLVIFYMTFSFFFLGINYGIEGVLDSAYAQQNKTTTKKEVKQSPAKKKAGEKHKEMILPEGTVRRRYNFVPTSILNLTGPYKISIVSGTLPQGIALNQRTGGFEGEPEQTGEWELTIQVIDAKGKKALFDGTIRVWRMLTVGGHGQFKGFDGLQMALNMAQDMDEIRIEKGIIEASGLVIPASKAWERGIRISGGWNETFEKNDNKPEETSLDGGGKENRILTISNSKGWVWIENLMFTNSKGGAVKGNGSFTNCTFTNNSAYWGGAVDGDGIFDNCAFTNNSAKSGGAVGGKGIFINCIFTNNSAESGGAVYGDGTFTNCTFTNNSANWGGAVKGNGYFTNCTFTNNNSSGFGGAVNGDGTFTNCTFINNNSSGFGGAVDGDGTFTNCTFTNNSAEKGGAVAGAGEIYSCTLYGNKAKESGGAFLGGGRIINSIFYKNTAAEKDNDITVNGDLEIDFSLLNYLRGAANYGANNIMGDPKFVDPDNGDFRLRSDSPAIDKGKLLPELKHAEDLDGKPRVVGGKIDMGAYEWQGN